MTHPPRSVSQTRMDSFLSSCQTKKSSVGPPRAVPLSFKMVAHGGVLFHRSIHLLLKAGSKRRPFENLTTSFSKAPIAAELLIGLNDLGCEDGDLIDSSESFRLQFS